MEPKTAIIVGAGHRALVYASYAHRFPDQLSIVGVVDPITRRREQVAKEFGLNDDQCLETAQQLAESPRRADFVINGTMDHQHVDTTVPLLDAGYDVLLEKPFATDEKELWTLAAAAKRADRRVAICHVLRYAPFYQAIRERVIEGQIGDVVNVQAVEHVSYHHVVVGFVRGKWSKKDYSRSTMLMAKSCHDLDLIAWMKSGIRPVTVSSFGSNFQFRPERAPAQSGERCVVDCPIESDCLYSARKHYIDHPDRWAFYVWDSIEHIDNPTIEDKLESLKTSPYGRCVWKCDNDVVDHQSVLIDFEDGATATLNMIGGTARPGRYLHLVGTKGEIAGWVGDNRFSVYRIDPRPGREFSEEVVETGDEGDSSGAAGGHAGGDLRLVGDFLRVLRGQEPSISSTDLGDSIAGHLLGFCADRSMEIGETVAVKFR
jgi:predicted dehydrogenase